jgi:hypothetical protein
VPKCAPAHPADGAPTKAGEVTGTCHAH